MPKADFTPNTTFKKNHKRYPLTTFQGELYARHLTTGTVIGYTSLIRRFLAWLGEGCLDEQGQRQTRTWNDRARAAAFQMTLPQARRGTFSCAYTCWLKFTRSPLLYAVSSHLSRQAVAAALQALINSRRNGGLDFDISEYPNLRWGLTRSSGLWCVYHTDRPDGECVPHPAYQALLTIIRDWGSTGCGGPLVPVHPESQVPMPLGALRRLLREEADTHADFDIQTVMDEAENAALTRCGMHSPPRPRIPAAPLHLPTRVPPQVEAHIPSQRGDGYTVYGRGKNARVVYDRDPEFEGYVVPADGPSDSDPEDCPLPKRGE